MELLTPDGDVIAKHDCPVARREQLQKQAEEAWEKWAQTFVRPIFSGSALDWHNLRLAYTAGYLREDGRPAVTPGETSIPDAAVEALWEAWSLNNEYDDQRQQAAAMARAAVHAAVPAIREAIAQDAVALRKGMLGNSQFADGYRTACNDLAARIIRGGTP